MHTKTEKAYSSIEQLKPYIDQCATYAGETHVEELQQRSATLPMAAERLLLSQIGEKRFYKAQKILQKTTGLNLQQIQHLRPMLISSLIDQSLLPQNGRIVALDQYLWQYAKSKDKTLSGIETVEDQIAVFDQLDQKTELKALLSTISNISRHRKNLLKTLDWYEQQDIQQLYRSTQKNLGQWRYLLLKKRNHRMANSIHTLCTDRSSFCTVGAAHLAGKEGVLRLLKVKGFRVRAVIVKP